MSAYPEAFKPILELSKELEYHAEIHQRYNTIRTAIHSLAPYYKFPNNFDEMIEKGDFLGVARAIRKVVNETPY